MSLEILRERKVGKDRTFDGWSNKYSRHGAWIELGDSLYGGIFYEWSATNAINF